MKKLLFIAAGLVMCVSAFAQGTITFNNRITGVVDWKVANGSSVLLSGTSYSAELWVGANAGSLAPATVNGTGAAVISTFRTGAAAGYFTTLGDVAVNGFAGGSSVTVQVRAWNNAGGTITSWANATERGQSGTAVVTLGGAGSPPSTAADLSGFGTGGATAFTITAAPEPSTIALGVLGMAGLVFIRRRK